MRAWIALAVALAVLAVTAIAVGAWLFDKRPLALYAWSTRGALARAGLVKIQVATPAGVQTVFTGGRGPAVVLLHGAGDQAGTWFLVVPELAKKRSLIVPDLAGHGGSAPSKGPIAFTQILEGVEGVIQSLVNTAAVTSAVADPNLADNNSELRLAVYPADLSVSKTASSNLLGVAQLLTYTIVVTNHGPLAGNGVRLTDTLPANVILGTIAASQGSCTGVSPISCNLGGLNVGEAATVTVIVTPTVTGAVVNTVVVSADEPDPDPADNTATVTTLVNPLDLSIKKTAAPNPAYAGGRLTYTLMITNNGPTAATGVLVTDTLPASVAFDSASSGCNLSNNQVRCSTSALAIGASQAFTIAVTPGAASGWHHHEHGRGRQRST